MFVRKNRNRNGSISVQVVSKDCGEYRVLRTVGSATNADDIKRLMLEAEEFIDNPPEQSPLFSMLSDTDAAIQNFLEHMENAQVRTIGPELIFGTLFDRLGFSAITAELFRHIVVARLAYPTSKLKTVDYLYRYRGIVVDVDAIYRFLDALDKTYKTQVQDIAFAHTKRVLGAISVIFYDMTTLYFEAEDEDDLRKIGFSKDGKFQHPQIMLGLLVGEGGFPIGYDIFKGNTFEGHTLLPMLKRIQEKYTIEQSIVVADAGLLSNDNIRMLIEERYQFIVGARIRNENEKTQARILERAKKMTNGDSFIIRRKDGTRLVVTYVDARAKKDKHNREKGLRKLRKGVTSGKLTKENINNRGYNKFLRLEGTIRVTIDEDGVRDDARWDGLKGYVTNTWLSPKKIVENYRNLWQIEKAFRISKTDLRIRPIHHYRKRRIEAHICIAFVAYAIYKELERQLHLRKVAMSPKRAAELTHTMYELEYVLPHSRKRRKSVLRMDAEQRQLYDAIRR